MLYYDFCQKTDGHARWSRRTERRTAAKVLKSGEDAKRRLLLQGERAGLEIRVSQYLRRLVGDKIWQVRKNYVGGRQQVRGQESGSQFRNSSGHSKFLFTPFNTDITVLFLFLFFPVLWFPNLAIPPRPQYLKKNYTSFQQIIQHPKNKIKC